MNKYLSWKIFAVLLFTLFVSFTSLPPETQKRILPFAPASLTNQKVNLGLDLQGGSQLEYKIDLRKVEPARQEEIVAGVLEVIEKRVNRLGVAEPNIYMSEVGDEKHIVVELAENANLTQEDVNTFLSPKKTLADLTLDEKKSISLSKAKDAVGKTIQLEFKEQKTELENSEKEKIKENATAALNKIKNGQKFETIGQEEELAYPGKSDYSSLDYTYASDINTAELKILEKLNAGEVSSEIAETRGSFILDASTNQFIEETGFAIVKLLDSKEEIRFDKSVDVSHILISYKNAERAEATVSRTKEEAQKLAEEVKTKLDGGAKFEDLAKEYSEDKSNKDLGGKLTTPVTGSKYYAEAFETATLALTKKDELTAVTETSFGFHIIKANEIKTDVKEKKYKYEKISYSTTPDPWKNTELTGENFLFAEVLLDPRFNQPYVSIHFDEKGSTLFEEITGRNVGKPVAIFVGGELISAPDVKDKITGGVAQIEGGFSIDEAKALARNLNTGAIPAPIILTGEYTIGATIGQEALDKSLKAGAIGFALVALFMIAFYRVPGFLAVIALVTYAGLLVSLIKSQLPTSYSVLISLVVFIIAIMKISDNKDSAWEKFLSIILACCTLFFLTLLLKTGVILTLAGIAGIILSVGMAVDANILIFERIKEELKEGKKTVTAIENGFERAWSSIRDSNFSTLITCAILFYFGSSIIRGFAFNLAAGVLISMFTALTITKTLMHGFAKTQMAKNLAWFGVNTEKKASKEIPFMKNAKSLLGVSGILVLIAVIATFSFGLKPGIDFTGGTLMEYSFKESVTTTQIKEALTQVETEINLAEPPIASAPSTTETGEITISNIESEKLDLSTAVIINSGENNFIIKTKYISSESHDLILQKLKEKLPEFEEKRFNTIGATVGKNLLQKSVFAILATLIIIVIYIAMAFRTVEKKLSPWKFGAAAIVALIHDIMIVIGVFALLGHFLNVEIDTLFITALLTVFGYSINDTIVVFDRLKENLQNNKTDNLSTIMNSALNQTLGRSLNTSISTLLTLIPVLFFGSSNIFYFVLALTLGIGVGAYSSIFVATPLLYFWNKSLKTK